MTHVATTAAAVRYIGFQEFDPTDHDYMIWNLEIFYNGFAGESGGLGGMVRWVRNANNAEKQSAERDLVNSVMLLYEPAASALSNANIQVSGRPV